MCRMDTIDKLPVKKSPLRRLLQSKLTPPVGSRRLVSRTRIVSWLQSSEHARLIMLRAPAGFGKTTLMVQLLMQLRNQGIQTAWLTLDEGDNDLGQFLTYLIAAIEKGIPGFERDAQETGHIGLGLNPTGVLLYLIDRISTFEAPFTIFLDDFGALHSPEALELVRQLLQHLPHGKRIIISLRHVPDPSLGRLRAQGELVDIDLEGLRFSREETAEFISQTQGMELDESDVEYLYQTTEGWVAGLQLFTLSSLWRDNKINRSQTFSSAFYNISEYLAEDVLTRQPENVQSFLLRTSILNRLSGSLCNALTGQSDGDMMLTYLEKHNLFLIPLDEDRSWYRFHSLFAKFLQKQLDRQGNDVHIELHRAAYDWYAASGEAIEAANHAMLAGATELAAQQLENSSLSLSKNGMTTTVAEWAERLPQEVLDQHPELLLSYIYALIFAERYEKAHEMLDRLTNNVHRLKNETYTQDLRIARGFILMSQERMKEFECVILEGLTAYDPAANDSHTRFLPVLLNMAGMLKLTVGRLEEALNIIWEGARLINPCRDEVLVYNKYFEGRIYLAQGKLQEALLLTRSILEEKAYGPSHYAAGGTAVAVLEAEVLYEKNDLENSEKLLTAYISILPTVIAVEAMIVGFRLLVRIRRAKGDANGARHFLNDLERIGIQRGIPRACASARQERIRIALQDGETGYALKISGDYADQPIWDRFNGYKMAGNDPETPEITRIRLMIGQNRHKEVLEPLKSELKKAESSGYFRQTLLLRILLAKACEGYGERSLAIKYVKEAILLAQDEEFIRCFLDEGEPVPKLVYELYRITIEDGHAGDGSISIEYVEKLMRAMGLVIPSPDRTSEDDSSLLDPLTNREKEILEKLALGFSNYELADKMCISVNTIRYHLRNIFSKLGTKSRAQAIVMARRLGLIK